MTSTPYLGLDQPARGDAFWDTPLNANFALLDDYADAVGRPWFNVVDSTYGATGNGTTDDSTAVGLAITAAKAAGGGIIFFPEGTYILANVTLDAATHIRFLGAAGAILKLKAGATNPMFRLGDTSANTNIAFHNLDFDGNAFTGTTNGIFLRVKLTTRLTVTECRFHDCWNHAIVFSASSTDADIVIARCRFEQVGAGYVLDNTFNASSPHGTAINISASVSDMAVTNCYFDQVKGDACIYVNGVTRLQVRGNRFRRTGYRAVKLTSAAVTGVLCANNSLYDIGAAHESSLADLNALKGQGTNGFYLTSGANFTAEDVLVIGNHVERCGENGIEGTGTFIGNTIIDTGYTTGAPYNVFGSGIARSGIYMGNGSSAVGNRIHNAASHGIHRFEGAASGTLDDLTIQSNRIVNPATKGIYLQVDGSGRSMNRCLVQGNHVLRTSGSPTHGVHLQLSNSATIAATNVSKDNTVIGTFSTAAYAHEGSTVTTSGNTAA